jgi:hypothetical protein
MADAKVDWYGEDVRLVVEGATAEILAELGFQVEGQAKVNIVANDQVDTGFMLNSGYTITPERSGYGTAKKMAGPKNPEAQMGPEPRLPEGAGAAVVWGAEYSIYQELLKSFLYRALEQVAKGAGGTIERVGKEELGG